MHPFCSRLVLCICLLGFHSSFVIRHLSFTPMTPPRFRALSRRYSALRIAILGDFCLDRYLEIDTSKKEISLETHLPVYNVTHVRSQPGGAGTIRNNLVALGVGTIFPIGFCGA